MALQAGVDSPMICHTYSVQAGAVDRICEAVEKGEISEKRIDESLSRLQKLKTRYTSWETALNAKPGSELAALNDRNAKLAQKVYSDATTVVRAESAVFPVSPTLKTLFISPGPDIQTGGGAVESGDASQPTRVPWVSSAFADEIKKFNPEVEEIRFTQAGDLSDEQWELVVASDVIILATRNARETPYQQKLGREISKRRTNRTTVSIATCSPYDFLEDSEMKNVITIYEPTVEAFRSAVAIIYGADQARGKLPVSEKTT
jgi:beta-N-acetylhexosaminidase